MSSTQPNPNRESGIASIGLAKYNMPRSSGQKRFSQSIASPSKESGPKGPTFGLPWKILDFRMQISDLKTSEPYRKECLYLNLQSTICNHKSNRDWPQGPGFRC